MVIKEKIIIFDLTCIVPSQSFVVMGTLLVPSSDIAKSFRRSGLELPTATWSGQEDADGRRARTGEFDLRPLMS